MPEDKYDQLLKQVRTKSLDVTAPQPDKYDLAVQDYQKANRGPNPVKEYPLQTYSESIQNSKNIPFAGMISPAEFGKIPTRVSNLGLTPKLDDVPLGANVGVHNTAQLITKYRDIAKRATDVGNSDLAKKATYQAGLLESEINTASNFTSPFAVGTAGAGSLFKPASTLGKTLFNFLPSAGFGVQGATQAIKGFTNLFDPKEIHADDLERILSGLSQLAFSGAGLAGTFEKPAENPRESYRLMRSAIPNLPPNFLDTYNDLIRSKDIATLNRDYKMGETHDSIKQDDILRHYLQDLFAESTKAALARHTPGSGSYVGSTKGVPSNDIMNAIANLSNPALDMYLPGRAKEIMDAMLPYQVTPNGEIPLNIAQQLLVRLNAEMASLNSLSPSDRKEVQNINAAKEVLSTSTDALRKSFYKTLGELGEKGVDTASKRYGELSELKSYVHDNIPRAEDAWANMPRFSPISDFLTRSFINHSLLIPFIGSDLVGHIWGPRAGIETGLGSLAALPIAEAVKTYKAQKSIPAEEVARAFRQLHQGTPERVTYNPAEDIRNRPVPNNALQMPPSTANIPGQKALPPYQPSRGEQIRSQRDLGPFNRTITIPPEIKAPTDPLEKARQSVKEVKERLKERSAVAPYKTEPNEPKNQRTLKIGRGTHGQVSVTFPDRLHADLYAYASRIAKSLTTESKSYSSQEADTKRLTSQLGISKEDLYNASKEYRDKIYDSIKSLKEGSSYDAPKFQGNSERVRETIEYNKRLDLETRMEVQELMNLTPNMTREEALEIVQEVRKEKHD